MTSPSSPSDPPRVSSNLIWAILATLFCCWPLGLIAIVKAAQVDGMLARGDYFGAQLASVDAKKWTFRSVVVMLVLYGVVGAIWLVGYTASGSY